MKSLITKRFQIFIRRFILGGFILLFPFVAEGALSAIIPGQTSLINSIRGIVNVVGTQDLSTTIKNYGNQKLPYRIEGAVDVTSLNTTFQNFYTAANRPGINLVQLDTSEINDYVLNIRKANVSAFLYDYFVGMSFNLTNSSYLQATGYYSTLAFHSSAVVLNEMNNILLKYYSNNNSWTLATVNSPLSSDSSLSNQTNFLEVLACIDSFPVSLLNFSNF